MLKWIIIGGSILFIIWITTVYNGFVAAIEELHNRWNEIELHLRRRHDLVQYLMHILKERMAHDKELLSDVLIARGKALGANMLSERSEAEHSLTRKLKRLFSVIEGYPDLKADGDVFQLQKKITAVEGSISSSRQTYNYLIDELNFKQRTFPSRTIASAFGLKRHMYF
ncbi:MAG: LemA family protein [Thermodesulfobacteriota bacterium]